MKLKNNIERLYLVGEEGETLTIEYNNLGEPFREGVSFTIRNHDWMSVMLDKEDTKKVADKLAALLGMKLVNK